MDRFIVVRMMLDFGAAPEDFGGSDGTRPSQRLYRGASYDVTLFFRVPHPRRRRGHFHRASQ